MGDKQLTVLVVTGGFLPGKKYMGITTSRVNLVKGLQPQCRVLVLTVNHDYRESAPYEGIREGWNTLDGMQVCYLAERNITKENVEQLLRREQVDVIHASGTITSYFQFNRPIFAAARSVHCPVVIAADGDICPSAVADAPVKMLGAAALCRLLGAFCGAQFHTTAQAEETGLRRYLGVGADRITRLPFFMHQFQEDRLRRNGKQPGVLRAVFCGRIHPIKNLAFALDAAVRVKARLELDIFGTVEDEDYWRSCKKIMDAHCNPDISIRYRGALEPGKASVVYKNYDCMILPTLGENYCFAIEESLSCGCPVIISRGTTPWDDVAGVAGYTVPLGDREAFTAAMERMAGMDALEYGAMLQSLEQYFRKKEDRENLQKEYLEMFRKVIDRK